jgi:MerR family transcriptional regulator, copper efflux regulator
MTSHNPPVACTLGGDGMKARAQMWRAVTAAALRTRSATSTGVRLEFDPDLETAHTLLDLVAAERDCCAWATWTLTSSAEAIVVAAQADQSAAPMLHAMFEARP